MIFVSCFFSFFFFNDTATTEIYTLSLHDALPIAPHSPPERVPPPHTCRPGPNRRDRKSTRLNSSPGYLSYAVFCLKKKKNHQGYHVDIQNNSNRATDKKHHQPP